MVDRDHGYEHQLLVVTMRIAQFFIVAVIIGLCAVTAARAFIGVGASITKVPVNATASGGAPVTNNVLLEDGSSSLLLEDGTSNLCMESGC